jgi:gamma-glutamyltranspeptidase
VKNIGLTNILTYLCTIHLNFDDHLIFRSIFINPSTNDTWKEGDLYKRQNLGQTFRRLAESGPDEFYSGETAKNMIKDLTDLGGIITMEDLKNYQ